VTITYGAGLSEKLSLRGKRYHARVEEGVNFLNPYVDTVLTFENNCLQGKLTFGDPFEDSGVVPSELGTKSKANVENRPCQGRKQTLAFP
jgi:hypothetical protein